MVARPPHDGKLGLCGISLTKARVNRDTLKAFGIVRAQLEPRLVASGYLEDAPFSWVTIAIRYGLKYDESPIVMRVDKKYGDLPLAIEVDTHDLREATLEQLCSIFRIAVLKALIGAGRKHNRPVEQFEILLAEAVRPS